MSDRLTDEQITEGLRLAGEATQGPWEWRDGGYADLAILRAPSSEVCNFGNCETYYPTEGTEPNAEDKALIAHAGTHYAAALAEVQALRGQVQAATDECDRIFGIYSSPLVGEGEAERVKRHAIHGIVEKIRGKVPR